MASSRRPTYKIEIKPLNERKRRKSDLVIMWQSVWDFTLSVLGKLWHMSNTFWEATDIWSKVDERREIQLWLETHLSKIPNDFSTSWRDGVLLCILLNKLHPGCYPDDDELNINFAVKNVHNAFNILEIYFNIVPKVTIEEIVTCRPGSDSKLVELLLQLKQNVENKCLDIKPLEVPDDSNYIDTVYSDYNKCIAKGTGLLVGFAGRVANFVIFYSSMSDLDLVIEIKGPSNSICSERITYRSPRKKRVVKSWKPVSRGSLARSISDSEKSSGVTSDNSEVETKTEQKNIHLEYEIHMNQINVAYTPLVKGRHKVVILYHGQHVSDSPYEVIIEPSVGTYRNYATARQRMQTCRDMVPADPQQNPVDSDLRKEPISLEEPNKKKDRLGKVVNRRVLRYIVKIDSKDVVVEADSINNLATSLLKMDYELQKCPLSRRNSWGFVGDAERKVSVIRQFCVDADELEAQSSKIHRSHSLIFSNKAKKLQAKCTSYECEDIPLRKKLETVREGCDTDITSLSILQDESDEVFAYFTDVLESGNEIPGALKNECKNTREMSYSPEEAKKLMSPCLEESISKATISSNSVKTPAAALKTFMESQDNITTQNDKISPDHSALTSEFSERNGTDMVEDALQASLFSTSLLSSENVTNPQCTDGNDSRQKKTEIFTGEESDFKRQKIEYLEINQANQIEENSKNCKNIKTTENSISKIRETNSKNCHYRDLLLPTSVKSQRSWIANPKENLRGKIYLKSSTKNINFLGSIKKFPYSISNNFKLIKLFQSQVNRELIKHHEKFIHKKYQQKQLQKEKCKTPSTDYLNFFENMAEKHSTNSESQIFMPKYKNYTNDRNNELASSYSKENEYENETNNFAQHVKPKSIPHFDKKPHEVSLGKKPLKIEPKMYSPDVISEPNKYVPTHEKHVIAFDTERNQDYQPCKIEKSLEPTSKTLHESKVEANNSTCDSTKGFLLTTRNLVSLGQFNFKHFNPPSENKKTSRVRNRIKQWQSTINEKASEQKEAQMPEIMPIDIKSKVEFWENFNKKNTSGLKNKESIPEYCEKETLHCINGTSGNNTDVFDSHMTGAEGGKILQIATYQTTQQKDNSGSINQEFNISYEKHTDEKLLLPVHATKVRKRSFSDPCVMATQEKDVDCAQQLKEMLRQPISGEDLSSSTDVNYIELSADDEISSTDLLYSTEDEYIDDEITESMSTYWGDLSLVKNWKISGSSAYKEFCSFLESEHFKDRNPALKSAPYECQVFGISNYFGHVSVKNRFWVLSNGAGYGNLSATVQGARQQDVAFVSVEYMQKDVYEVTYQVLTPGLYLISVRWMETPILGSPFLCKVTY